MTDARNKALEQVAGESEHAIQFRVRDSKKGFYSEARDILGFYITLQRAVIDIIGLGNPDKSEEVNKLQMQANGFINEATGGARKLTLEQFIEMHRLVLDDIDTDIVEEYTRLMCAAFMFRYVTGKREQASNPLPPEDLGRTFESLYILSVLPEPLAGQVKQHLLAYGHLHDIAINHAPPCDVVEVDGEEGTDDQQA